MRVDPGASFESGFQGRFVGELIAARSRELAELAAAELIARNAPLAERYRPLPREKWVASYVGRLADLAAALFAERPDLLAAQVAWARTAFAARGAPVDDLRDSLVVLREVLLREVTPEDASIVDECLSSALRTLEHDDIPPSRLTTDTPQGRVAAAYLLKILEGDRIAAGQVVHQAVRNGLCVRRAYLDVLVPVQQELGRMWHLNEITIAEEHFATSTTLAVMSQLLPLAEIRPRDGRAMLAASVDGNTHDLGVRVVADFFEMAGWRTVHLGASVPAEDLVIAVRDFNVDLIALSVALTNQVPVLMSAIESLRITLGDQCPKILVGGPAFSGGAAVGHDGRELWRGIGADGFAASADAAVTLADRLVPPRA